MVISLSSTSIWHSAVWSAEHEDDRQFSMGTVTYAATGGLNLDTIVDNHEAIRVTGPNGFEAFASFHAIDRLGDGTPRDVTYLLPAPEGGWHDSHEGTYTVHHGDETSELTIPSEETVCH